MTELGGLTTSPKAKQAREEECLKKVAELEASLQAERQKEETYLNQLKYARADVENLQKQMQKRIDEAVSRGNERLVVQLLPVVEDLDLAAEAATSTNNGSLLEGIEMVRRKLGKVLESEGLTPIEALGRAFDPHLHEAVLEVESCDHADGTVIEEFRKGYLYKGRVLRASMVKVARSPSSKEVQEVREDEQREEGEDTRD